MAERSPADSMLVVELLDRARLAEARVVELQKQVSVECAAKAIARRAVADVRDLVSDGDYIAALNREAMIERAMREEAEARVAEFEAAIGALFEVVTATPFAEDHAFANERVQALYDAWKGTDLEN